MPHPALSIANATLDIAWERQDKITPLKLQKFVYIAHGFSLAITEVPLIEETVIAWDWGPVIPVIYREFKRYGKDPIQDHATMSIKGKRRDIPPPKDEIVDALLKGVWGIYGKMDGYQLANLTHEKGAPWEQTWNGGKGKDKIIDNDLIMKYYENVLEGILNKKAKD